MTTAQVGYAPVHRWVKHVLGDTHTTVVVTVAWAVLCLLVAQRVTSGRSGPCLTGRAGRLRPVVPPAGATLVARAGARSGHDQSRVDPPGAHARGGGPARRGTGHDPARALGSLVGGHRRRWSHAPHRLGGHPVSLAQGALPGHDAGAHPAAAAGLPGRRALDAGGGSRVPERQCCLPSCARAARTSACGCG